MSLDEANFFFYPESRTCVSLSSVAPTSPTIHPIYASSLFFSHCISALAIRNHMYVIRSDIFDLSKHFTSSMLHSSKNPPTKDKIYRIESSQGYNKCKNVSSPTAYEILVVGLNFRKITMYILHCINTFF